MKLKPKGFIIATICVGLAGSMRAIPIEIQDLYEKSGPVQWGEAHHDHSSSSLNSGSPISQRALQLKQINPLPDSRLAEKGHVVLPGTNPSQNPGNNPPSQPANGGTAVHGDPDSPPVSSHPVNPTHPGPIDGGIVGHPPISPVLPYPDPIDGGIINPSPTLPPFPSQLGHPDSTSVPDGGTTAAMLGMAVFGMVLLRKRWKLEQVSTQFKT